MKTPAPPKLPDYLSDLVDAAMNGPDASRHMLQLSRVLMDMRQLEEADLLANWVLESYPNAVTRQIEAANLDLFLGQADTNNE